MDEALRRFRRQVARELGTRRRASVAIRGRCVTRRSPTGGRPRRTATGAGVGPPEQRNSCRTALNSAENRGRMLAMSSLFQGGALRGQGAAMVASGPFFCWPRSTECVTPVSVRRTP